MEKTQQNKKRKRKKGKDSSTKRTCRPTKTKTLDFIPALLIEAQAKRGSVLGSEHKP